MRERPRPKKDDDGEEGGDEWLLTYGDLMTQLVCFFVLLMSFAVVSQMKFREVVVSLHDALSGSGVLPSFEHTVSDVPIGLNKKGLRDDKKLKEMKKKIKEALEKTGMSAHVEIEIREAGLVIILNQRNPPVFFDTADDHIKEGAYPILSQIGKFMKILSNDVRVEGHTDSRPIKTLKFPSNWHLAFARAYSVMVHLQIAAEMPPDRFSAVSHGPERPIALNDTKLGMSRNRRVEIIILREEEEEELTQEMAGKEVARAGIVKQQIPELEAVKLKSL